MGPGEIRQIRKNLKMTQESLALLIGVNKSSVHRWEKGRLRPRLTARIMLRQLQVAEKERRVRK